MCPTLATAKLDAFAGERPKASAIDRRTSRWNRTAKYVKCLWRHRAHGWMLSTNVKVTPPNQTLILASERANSAVAPGMMRGVGRVLDASPSGAVLRRLTIVAEQPDEVVYIRADYAPAHETATGADAYAIVSSNRSAVPSPPQEGLSAYRNPVSYRNGTSNRGPVEQYAQTQRMLNDTPAAPLIDVHA